jgi:hypothetical protein
MQSAWCVLLQEIELMPQCQDFGFQPLPRLDRSSPIVEWLRALARHAHIRKRGVRNSGWLSHVLAV